jgi:signal transduction histidine kinase
MRIREKLTIQFAIIVVVILLFSAMATYFFSSEYRQDDFYTRLDNKAKSTVSLLLDVEEIDADMLRRIEKDNPVSLPEEILTIYDFENDILYESRKVDDVIITPAILDEVRLAGEKRWKVGRLEVLAFLHVESLDRVVVVIAANDIFGRRKLNNLSTILFIVLSIGSVVILLAGWFYSGRALKPISKVVDQVERIGIENLNTRVSGGSGKDEIAVLASTFNEMLERLESAFKMQKNFIANASHELRTPMTSITGQIEVVMLKERSNEEYLETLSSILEDVKHLNQTSNRLLLLAQVSSELRSQDHSEVRMDELIWQVVSEQKRRMPAYEFNVSFDDQELSESELIVVGDEQLLKTALSNLMENGCKYSEDNTVHIRLYKQKGKLAIDFKDQGIGIAEEDIEGIFQPFYRAKNSLYFKGHGIGLSLVKNIVALHKGEILFNSKLNQGSTFTLIL